MADFLGGCAFIPESDSSDGIIYIGSILSVICARAMDRQASKQTNRIAYYCPGPLVARLEEKVLNCGILKTKFI